MSTQETAQPQKIEDARIQAKWVAAKYGPKTIGMGHAGGPAMLMIRPAEGPLEWVQDDIVRLKAAVNAVRGIPTEALDAGVVREMVEALETLVRQVSCAHYLIIEACGPTNASILEQCMERARTVLAKLRGGAE